MAEKQHQRIYAKLIEKYPHLVDNDAIMPIVITTTNRMIDLGLTDDNSIIDNIEEELRGKKLLKYECYFPDILSRYFTQVTAPNDGNCFFHCIALALNINGETNYTAERVRRGICKYMKDYKPFLQQFVAFSENVIGDISYDEYVTRMEKNNEWGGEPEMLVVMYLYNLRIINFTDVNKKRDNLYPPHTATMSTLLRKNDDTVLSQEELPKFTRTIYLYHCSKNEESTRMQHFELLKPIRGKEEEIKEKEVEARVTQIMDNNPELKSVSNIHQFLLMHIRHNIALPDDILKEPVMDRHLRYIFSNLSPEIIMNYSYFQIMDMIRHIKTTTLDNQIIFKTMNSNFEHILKELQQQQPQPQPHPPPSHLPPSQPQPSLYENTNILRIINKLPSFITENEAYFSTIMIRINGIKEELRLSYDESDDESDDDAIIDELIKNYNKLYPLLSHQQQQPPPPLFTIDRDAIRKDVQKQIADRVALLRKEKAEAAAALNGGNSNNKYKNKYLKYKNKYLLLKK